MYHRPLLNAVVCCGVDYLVQASTSCAFSASRGHLCTMSTWKISSHVAFVDEKKFFSNVTELGLIIFILFSWPKLAAIVRPLNNNLFATNCESCVYQLDKTRPFYLGSSWIYWILSHHQV